MGRKRNKGKARRTANANKAREEVNVRGNNQRRPNNGPGPSESKLGQQLILLRAVTKKCMHGERIDDVGYKFLDAFRKSYNVAGSNRNTNSSLKARLIAAEEATWREFAIEVWGDADKIEQTISFLSYEGAEAVLDDDIDHARNLATFVRYLEEHIAVVLNFDQATTHWSKIEEMYFADIHTLAKFFKKRIPCSCLDEKLKEVKDITKVSICYNPQCPIPRGEVERSKTMCCSRCRIVMYCSRECQKAHWKTHKPHCGETIASMARHEAWRAEAELEDKLQNM